MAVPYRQAMASDCLRCDDITIGGFWLSARTERRLDRSSPVLRKVSSTERGFARLGPRQGFRSAVADPFTHSIFARFDTDGDAFTGTQRYLCGGVPSSFSKAGLSRLKQGAAPDESRFEEITASARQSWRTAIRRLRM